MEYWVHKPSGLVWAVSLVDDEVMCAAGPLDSHEADPDLLAYLDYSRPDGQWVAQRLGEFELISSPEPPR